MKDLVSIGKILKTHGFKGAVKVFVDPVYMDDFEETITAIFIDNIPYFITDKDINSDEQAILILEEITSKEAAQKLCGKEMKVPADQLEQVFEAEHYDEWTGFLVKDKTLGKVGTITGITELPHQVLLQVIYQDHEILIPINDAFISAIDADKKEIEVTLPPGFLDIF
jgi:16S rRNA processing protein RimM